MAEDTGRRRNLEFYTGDGFDLPRTGTVASPTKCETDSDLFFSFLI